MHNSSDLASNPASSEGLELSSVHPPNTRSEFVLNVSDEIQQDQDQAGLPGAATDTSSMQAGGDDDQNTASGATLDGQQTDSQKSTPAAPTAPHGQSSEDMSTNNKTDAGGNGKAGTVKFEWKKYEKKLVSVKRIAVGTNVFYALNWFLGFCALTWATTVILGGMVTSIRQRDYFSVALLLILEALRLATARFFGFFTTKHLIHCSADPRALVYNDGKELVAKELLRTLSQVLELSVLSVSIVLPSRRLRDVHYHLEDSCQHPDSSVCNFNAVQTSLKIFYSIVLANAFIAVVGVLYSKTVMYVAFNKASYALRRYYHSIVWNGIVKGLLQCTDLDVMKFAFQIQAEEYKNNKRAPVVKDMYEDLMKYLYEHPKHKGFEATKVALDSEDTFVREAAANLVGLWIDLGIGGGDTLILQEVLLSKLADALEHEETGRAATSSFEQMARKFPHATAEVKNSRDQRLVDIMIKKIHQVVVQNKTDKVIVFVKVLIVLMEKLGKGIKEYSDTVVNRFETLRDDLVKVVQQSKLKRSKVLAAYALVKLREMEQRLWDSNGDDIVKIRNFLQDGREEWQAAKAQASNGTQAQANNGIQAVQGQANNGTQAQGQASNGTQAQAPNVRTGAAATQFCRGFYSLIRSCTIWLVWDLIVDCLVGKDPNARSGSKSKAKEHILNNEAEYLGEVVDIFSEWQRRNDISPSLTKLEVINNEGLLPWWKPEDIQVRQTSESQYKLPKWLENIKMTTYIAAIVMAILTLGVSAILIFYPHIHI